MKIAIASDHRGYDAKVKLLSALSHRGLKFTDFGCNSPSSCDYPDFAIPAARAVASGACDVGILLDGSGVGMSIAANKVPGVRAALAHEEVSARRAREHHHCNILCLAADLLGAEQLPAIVECFLNTEFGTGRHSRRVGKILQFEAELYEGPAQTNGTVISTTAALRSLGQNEALGA